ncbi:hypothetical protein ABW19_dt0205010 [Dactylella cylindrospora]|nr:hypothetical protein ABW19_dt0205010 [Dactylella cylindrospora]
MDSIRTLFIAVDAEMLELADSMEESELKALAQLQGDGDRCNSNNFDLRAELQIFLYSTLYQKTGEVEHLETSLRCASEWLAGVSEGHVDWKRRSEIHEAMASALGTYHQLVEKAALGPSRTCYLRNTVIENELQEDVSDAPTTDIEASETQDVEDPVFDRLLGYSRRFQRSKDIKDLNLAIRETELVLHQTTEGHPLRLPCLGTLGNLLGERFDILLNSTDIERAIKFGTMALDATPAGDEWFRVTRMNNLSHLYDRRFRREKSIEDSNRAINLLQQALDISSANRNKRALVLSSLGLIFGSRFASFNDIRDLKKAVLYCKAAVGDTPLGHQSRGARISNLQNVLERALKMPIPWTREEIDQRIQIATIHLEFISLYSNSLARVLSTLGKLYKQSYQCGGHKDVHVIDQAIEYAQNAVDLTPSDHPVMSQFLADISETIFVKVQSFLTIEDLDKGVQASERALEAAAQNGLGQSFAAAIFLAGFLSLRSDYKVSVEDLDRALILYDEALGMVDTTDKSYPVVLMYAGNAYHKRFRHTANDCDFKNSIKALEEAVAIAGNDHLARPMILLNLANKYGARFEQTGDLDDINRAIEYFSSQQSLGLAVPNILCTLGLWLGVRSNATRSMEDLADGISYVEAALEATPLGHPNRPRHATGLAQLLKQRFTQSSLPDVKDLDMAIKALETAEPLDELTKSSISVEVASIHSHRFLCKQNISDLDKAIGILSELLDEANIRYEDLPQILYNIASYYFIRFKVKRDPMDLDQAIETVRTHNEVVLDSHPHKGPGLRSLGGFLLERSIITRDREDLVMAESAFRSAWNCASSPPYVRISAAEWLAFTLKNKNRWDEASAILEEAVKLLIFATPRTLQSADRQRVISEFYGLASFAAAASLNANGDAVEALRVLESGRSIVIASLFETRIGIPGLEEKEEDLAKRFNSLRSKLYATNINIFGDACSAESSISTDSRKSRSREIEKELTAVIEEIRTRPPFENFLLSPSPQEMMKAAEACPIAVINVNACRCDAFLIESNQIRVIELHGLHVDDIYNNIAFLRKNEESAMWKILEWLWDTIACPVLNALGMRASVPADGHLEGPWPHICWIPTGQLSLFPLHAAGRHLGKSKNTVLDRCISSYGLSIKSLIYGRQSSASLADESRDALIVPMPTTPGQSSLYYVQDEVETLKGICKDLHLVPIIPAVKRRADVLSLLRSCKIFHFAGHGKSDSVEPSQSCMLLDDWQKSPLTAADLWDCNLQKKPPFLAYLSACSTGKTGQPTFSDEGVHLISACQLAGFQNVVGALWEVSDFYCVETSTVIYETIKSEGMTDKAVALGLHRAIRRLRREAIEGASDDAFLTDLDSDEEELEADTSELVDTLQQSRLKPSLDSTDEDTNVRNKNMVREAAGNIPTFEWYAFLGNGQGITNAVLGDRNSNERILERDVEAEEDDEGTDGVQVKRPPLYWIPYVHYGILRF